MDRDLQEVVDYVALTRLQDAYADTVNRRAWEEFHDLFLPDAPVTINKRTAGSFQLIGPAAVGEFISEAIEVYDFFEFVILNRRVFLGTEVEGSRAAGRLYFAEHRQERSSGRWSCAYAVYHDHYEKSHGEWRFASRQHHSLARTGPDFEVFPFPDQKLL